MTGPSKSLIRYELLSPEDSGSGGESEFAADMSELNNEGGDNDATDTDGDEDSGGREDEDRSSSSRARSAASEDQEDSEGQDDEDEDDEAVEGSDEDDDELDEEGVTPIGDEEDKEQPQYARPPIKEIKAKYPKLFQEYPQLKAAFFNYPQYTELFADVDSAREAVGKAQEYDTLEATIVGQGDAKLLLSSLSDNNPKALKRLAANFSDSLKSVDQDAYMELANPIIEELLYHAAAHGNKVGNKNLQLAARHIANFVFANGGEIPDIAKKADRSQPSEAEIQLQSERESYAKEKFQGALGDVIELIGPDIQAILGNKLDGLTGFERKQIIKEAKTEVDRILTNDRSFQASLRNLWKKAESTGYSSESKSRIKRAWLDRAKLIAPQVRNRLRQEALNSRNGSKRAKASEEEGAESKVKFKVTSEKKTFPSGGGKTPTGATRRVLDPKKIDWRKTSDRDILDMK